MSVRKGRGSLFVFTNSSVIKLFSPFGPMPYRKQLEYYGNEMALLDQSWPNQVNPITRLPGGFVTPRGAPADATLHSSEIEALLWKRITSQLDSGQTIPATFIFRNKSLDTLRKHGIRDETITYLLGMIKKLHLPAGSIHGDAHIDNFITINNELRLIDWTAYREKHSPVFDLLYWYADVHRRKNATDQNAPTNYHDSVLEIPAEWDKLARLYSDMSALRVFFIIARTLIKLEIKQSPEKLKNRKISRVIETLYNEHTNNKRKTKNETPS